MICNARSVLIDVVTAVYTNSRKIPELCLKIILSFQIHSYHGHNASRKPKGMHVTLTLTIKPTRCTNFSNLFWKWNSTCFGQFLCPSSGVIHCTHSNGICHTDSFQAAGSGWNSVPSWSCCLKAIYKPVWHIPLLCVQWKTPDDGQRNCSKHAVSFRK
jgi:hypothetical protein